MPHSQSRHPCSASSELSPNTPAYVTGRGTFGDPEACEACRRLPELVSTPSQSGSSFITPTMRPPGLAIRAIRPSRGPYVCHTCRAARRGHSTASPAPPPVSGIAPLASRRLISVAGPDAAKYLQGAITGSVAVGGSPRAGGFYTAFLSAQGRVLHDVFIYPDTLTDGGAAAEPGTRFLVEVDAGEVQRLERLIKRYKLRSRFATRVLDVEEAGVWHAWNDDTVTNPDNPIGYPQRPGHISLLDPRISGMGIRFITQADPSGRPPVPQFEADAVDESAYRVRRYLRGVAEGQGEILYDRALPLESNLDATEAIDFHKGCYVGQELTIRTRHRGVVRKRILPCMVYAEARAVPRTLTYTPSGGDGEEAVGEVNAAAIPADASIGRVGKAGRSPGRWLAGVGNIGLALCRLETMTDVVLQEEAAGLYSPETEFRVATSAGEDGAGESVKIKAFVPEWLRAALGRDVRGEAGA
jgi:transferase CAF17, mitochondrial